MKRQTKDKDENRLYFCSLCEFTATSYEELDVHYSLAHDDTDLSYELEAIVNKKTKKQKRKDLKGKAIEQLSLMVKGISYKNEYVGWCETRYELYSEKIGNKYIIELVPGITVC